MLRAVLSTVLFFLLALPHGVCFCDFLRFEANLGHDDCSQHDSDDDDSDSPQSDCTCKLREAMVLDAGRTQSVSDDDQAFVAEFALRDLTAFFPSDPLLLRHVNSADLPDRLAVRALRI